MPTKPLLMLVGLLVLQQALVPCTDAWGGSGGFGRWGGRSRTSRNSYGGGSSGYRYGGGSSGYRYGGGSSSRRRGGWLGGLSGIAGNLVNAATGVAGNLVPAAAGIVPLAAGMGALGGAGQQPAPQPAAGVNLGQLLSLLQPGEMQLQPGAYDDVQETTRDEVLSRRELEQSDAEDSPITVQDFDFLDEDGDGWLQKDEIVRAMKLVNEQDESLPLKGRP